MKLKFFILVMLSIQSIASEFTDALEKANLININSLMIFTSDDMLSSGRYKFGDDDYINDDIHIINFPYRHHFKPYNEYLNFFVNGSVGYSHKDHSVNINKIFGITDPADQVPNDHVDYHTYAIKLGGGIRVTPGWDLEMLFGGAFIYTHIKSEYNYNSPESEAILKPIFDKTFANKSSDNFSYELSMQYGYFPDFEGWKPYILAAFNYYDTKSDFSLDSFSNYTTESSVSKLKTGLRTPALFDAYHIPTSLGGFIEGDALHGDMKNILGFDHYGAVGASLHFGTRYYTDLIEELSVEYSQVEGDGISGYTVGMGFDVAF